ncbi:MAG TPA: DUF4214 domain-containing protein [Paucimonas sp.]|nr:DUF4214 domain-containing protein [Paucimonas sp.]
MAAADYNTVVQQLYVAYFGRPADPVGLANFTAQLNAIGAPTTMSELNAAYATDSTVKTLVDSFGTSTESTSLYTGSTVAFVNAIFQNVLGRSAALEGLLYWSAEIDSGRLSRGKAAMSIMAGAQTNTTAQGLIDAAVIANKTTVATNFTTGLNTAEEVIAYSGSTAAANARTMLGQVTNTTDTTAFQTTVDSTITTIVNTPTVAGSTFQLTAGTDKGTSFTGSAGNDSFVGYTSTATNALTSFDSIDGGAGTDALDIVVTAALDLTANVSTTVKNIETASLISSGKVDADVSGWTGLTSLTVSGVGGNTANKGITAATTTDITLSDSALAAGNLGLNGGKAITVTATGLTNLATNAVTIGATTAAKGAVTVSTTGSLAADTQVLGDIAITGGTTVSVTQNVSATAAYAATVLTGSVTESISSGNVTVTGTSDTTSVTVTDTAAVTAVNSATAGVVGITNGTVTITDANAASATAAGTINTVTLSNFGAATVNSGALATVNLSGKGTSFTGTAGALTTPTATTLALNLNNLTTTGAVTLDSDYTTLNIASSTKASTLNSLVASGATTVNVSGDAALTLTGQTLTAATAINVTNTAGVTLGSSLATGTAFTGGTGADSVIVGATTKAIAMGAGDDTVTASVALGTGGSIDAGEGTDTLSMTSANAAARSASSTFEGVISNFEVLELGDTSTADAIDLGNLDDISTITSAGVSANGLTLTNLGATNSVEFTGLIAAASSIALASSSGSSDTVNLKFSATNGFTSTAALTIGGVENINITTDDTDSTAATTAFTQAITAAAAKAVTVTGDVGINLNGLNTTTLTSLDASGVTATGAAGAVTLTTGALAAAATLKGGAGNDTLIASTATKALTMSGNGGDDVLTGGDAADTISGGTGDDIIDGDAAGDTLTGDAGADLFLVTAVTDSNGVNQDTITDFVSATDKIGIAANVTYAGEANGYGAVLTSLTGVAYQAVLDTSTSTLYVDVDASQTLTSADITMKLNSVTDLAQADFARVGTSGGDAITGTANGEYIYGFAGADTFTGGLGADTIFTGAGADNVVITGGLTMDTVKDFTTGAGGDKVQLDISELETAGAVEAAITLSLDDLVDGTTAIGASAATIQEVADQAGGAAAAAAGAATVYVLLTETYADLAALETGLETGDHELTVHANAAQHDGFIVVWSDGTDSHVSLVRIAVDSGADFAAGDLVATDLAKIVGTGTLTAGEIHADNFAFIA